MGPACPNRRSRIQKRIPSASFTSRLIRSPSALIARWSTAGLLLPSKRKKAVTSRLLSCLMISFFVSRTIRHKVNFGHSIGKGVAPSLCPSESQKQKQAPFSTPYLFGPLIPALYQNRPNSELVPFPPRTIIPHKRGKRDIVLKRLHLYTHPTPTSLSTNCTCFLSAAFSQLLASRLIHRFTIYCFSVYPPIGKPSEQWFTRNVLRASTTISQQVKNMELRHGFPCTEELQEYCEIITAHWPAVKRVYISYLNIVE